MDIWKIWALAAWAYPTATTGSVFLVTHWTMMVPRAMLWAASSIHHSPFCHRLPSALTSTALAAALGADASALGAEVSKRDASSPTPFRLSAAKALIREGDHCGRAAHVPDSLDQ